MVVLDEMSDLGRDFGAIPSHDQHLANGPVIDVSTVENQLVRSDTYQSRSCHSGSRSTSNLAMLRDYHERKGNGRDAGGWVG